MIEPGKHKLTEALKDTPPAGDAPANHAGPPEPKGHGSTPEEVAEETRREQEARTHGVPDRDQYLTNIGRGEQTHG